MSHHRHKNPRGKLTHPSQGQELESVGESPIKLKTVFPARICEKVFYVTVIYTTEGTFTSKSLFTETGRIYSVVVLNPQNLLTMASYKIPGEHIYDGIVFGEIFPAGVLDAVKKFPFKEDDILIATYPKSGIYKYNLTRGRTFVCGGGGFQISIIVVVSGHTIQGW